MARPHRQPNKHYSKRVIFITDIRFEAFWVKIMKDNFDQFWTLLLIHILKSLCFNRVLEVLRYMLTEQIFKVCLDRGKFFHIRISGINCLNKLIFVYCQMNMFFKGKYSQTEMTHTFYLYHRRECVLLSEDVYHLWWDVWCCESHPSDGKPNLLN